MYCILNCSSQLFLFFLEVKDAANILIDQYIENRFDNRVPFFYQCPCVMPLSLIHHKGSLTGDEIIYTARRIVNTGHIGRNYQEDFLGELESSVSFLPNKTTKIANDVNYIYSLLLDANVSKILVEGVGGIGKTVLSKEIVYCWAVNAVPSTFELVLLLSLRHCNLSKINTIEDLLRHVFKTDNETPRILQRLSRTKGKNILLVIDGYDEISDQDRANSFVADIIYKRVPLLLKCAMVITCRSHVSLDLNIYHRIHISGLEEIDKFKYINEALKPAHASELRHYLNSNPTIRGICCNPLILTILCSLVTKGTGKLAGTQTKLFKEFILAIVIHNLKRDNSGVVNSLITGIAEFDQLPECYFEIFKELSHLAFHILQLGNSVLKLNDIKERFPNLANKIMENPCGFGLLNARRHIEDRIEYVSVHFIHFSIQEYMAAYHISLLSNCKLIKLLHDTFWEVDYYNTWILYFGITNGEKFALKHFLSGNYLEMMTRYSRKNFTISQSIINNEIKRLHVIQCFAETDNTVSVCNPSREVKLRGQTLSIDDVHAVGFFFLRSTDNHWEFLDLRNCKIGDTGLEILVEKFDGKKSITIAKIDFSGNHFEEINSITDMSSNVCINYRFFSLLFKLTTIFHTVELILSDQVKINNRILHKIEQALDQSELSLVIVGSNLFAHSADQRRFLAIVSDTMIDSLLVMKCKWELDTLSLTGKQLSKLHVSDLQLNSNFVEFMLKSKDKRFSNKSKDERFSNIFIHDHSLSHQLIDKIGNLLLEANSKPPFVYLIIGKTLIKGKFYSSNLRGMLSNTEILNLYLNLERQKLHSWRKDLCFYGNESYHIMCIFIKLLQRINTLQCLACQLRFCITENRALIAHNMNHKDILRELALHKNFNAIYTSNCKSDKADWQRVITNLSKQGDLRIFSVYNDNSPLSRFCITHLLSCRSVSLTELFLHCNYDYSLPDDWCVLCNVFQCTALVFLTKSELISFQPTCEQISLALQLEPNVMVWKMLDFQLKADSAFQLITLFGDLHKNFSELNLKRCCVQDFECDMIYKNLKNGFTVNTLNISSSKITATSACKLLDVILNWRTKTLIIGENRRLCTCLVKILEKKLITNQWKSRLFLSIVSGNKITCFCYKLEWDSIIIDSVTSLYVIQCQVPSDNWAFHLSKHPGLHQIYIINSTLHEQAIVDIVKILMNSAKKVQISIHDQHIGNTVVNQLRKVLLSNSKLSIAMCSDSFLFIEQISTDQQSILEFLNFI